MKKPFFISLGIHIGIFIILYIVCRLLLEKKKTRKVYSVKIISAPQPEPEKTVVEEKSKKVEEKKPKTRVEKESKKKRKKSTKKKPQKESKPAQKKKTKKNLARGSASIDIEGQNFSDDFYLNLIMTKIANNWLNPLRGGRKMSVTIYFRIQKNGTVSDVKVEKKSGNSLLDQSALRAVLASSPLPPLPESYSGDFLGVHFEFEHTGR
ncbi:TonB C-terminal domain-containing protein [bacterium]|nr:TonB C-terminal domain-containing protein [bacterium]